MNIGIDQIGLYSPEFFIDLRQLANARGVDPDKYTIGIGQDEQAVPPSSQDVVTMGAAAVRQIQVSIDSARLGLIVLGTESGIDASKAGALFIQKLTGLPETARTLEIKEACYGGTAGLMMARDYVAAHPRRQALVIAADIARYGLNTAGEVTQGAGAVAMLISAEPRILVINDDSVVHAEDIGDFWRPVYTDQALARGKYSTEQYLHFFALDWAAYKQATGRTLSDFKALTFHLPYTKMGLKALRQVLPEVDATKQQDLLLHFDHSIQYSRRIGNIYTGSLYLGLLSLLENDDSLAAGDLLGLFSYGSGAVGEFFSGALVEGYRDQLHGAAHIGALNARRQLSVAEYEAVFQDAVPYAKADYRTDPNYFAGPFVLTGVTGQERQYQAN
ncbi:hydroxymethylglutaryl-CoA synthase [Lacticaseibacillus camelliae]|uniref:3-hydroxy-3-methylglutaryl CoA synthase n=1 Tax=Lacticaseibacillus camelliae DSM 22697 = JCM 13995 TaxID=1423730 RepID=A0A0R2FE35_9LACO|nr:hydroxymethylglutaryl-CoA synthase [Lacticaseibacillus camelliae]KRN25814.1 3-hydroxy-3-methylglutaryl CoA synthase [Lacticaseibacillus camelliae DSM 22697 = JCM 13995]